MLTGAQLLFVSLETEDPPYSCLITSSQRQKSTDTALVIVA